ncbi:MAG: GGDEF domain-containing protein [Motiliproteus sp.]
MDSNNSDTDIKEWKKRCLRLEQQQENNQNDGEQLCKLAQRLSAIAQGVDKNLDAQLQPLQESIKEFPPNSKFNSQVHSIENSVLQVLQRRDDGVRFSQESMSKLIRQLADLVDDPQISSKYEQLQNDVVESVEQLYEHPRLLNELLRFQAMVLDVVQKADVSSEAVANKSTSAEDSQEFCRHVGQLLLKLLGQLSIPKALLPKARDLRERIEAEFSWDEIETLLQGVVDFAVKATDSDHKEFENYLQSINVQLDGIQSFLGESRQHQIEAQESGRKLDESVRGDVAKLEDTLSSSTGLEQLKQSVRSQLGGIVNAVDSYRHDQQQRESAAEGRLQQLQEQIELMEEKAAVVQGHLEEQRLRAMSDPLTGLPNRAAYDEAVEAERDKAANNNSPLTLVICDLDHFKRVNDGFGHLAGDKVLKLVAKILRGGLRMSDFIGRYGGEEFVMVLPGTTVEQALEVMEKLRRVMEQSPFNFKGQPVQVTMSFGVAENLPHEKSDDLFSRADKALYQAKEQGRNCCVVAE